MSFLRRTPVFIGLMCLLAIAIRIPNLDRPLSKHHEFCTAVSLIVMQAWYDGGIRHYDFAPSTNFPGDHNRGIRNLVAESVEKNGQYYYISHPPFAYYLPFAVFKLTDTRPNVLGLQVLNMVAHLVSAVFIFLLAGRLFPRARFVALASCAIYLFNPATLWFQSNVYMADMFVQPFFIMTMYFLVRLVQEEATKYRSWFLLAFGLSLFGAVYTEWLGLMLTGVLFVFAIVRRTTIRGPLLLVISLAGAIPIALTAVTYSGVAGEQAMVEYFFGRFQERGLGGNVLASLWVLAKNYVFGHLPLLLFLVIGFWFVLRQRVSSDLGRNAEQMILLTVIPVLLHHVVFLQYSGHDFAALKSAVPLALLGGWLVNAITSIPRQTQGDSKVARLAAPIVAVCILSVAQYYYINRPGDVSWKGDRYAQEMEIGLEIKKRSEQDEITFTKDIVLTPQIIYYAQRNIMPVGHKAEAYNFVREHALGKGVLVQSEDNAWQSQRIIREE